MALAIVLAATGVTASPVTVRITPDKAITDGFSPNIQISGLAPRARVRVHSFTGLERWQRSADGQYPPARQDYHGWADVVADGGGRVAMDRAAVRRGTYVGVDGYGLFWSMRRAGDPALADTVAPSVPTAPGVTRVVVEQRGHVLASVDLTIAEPAGLRVRAVTDGALNGVFAAPAGRAGLPTIILLHGSEGGGACRRSGRGDGGGNPARPVGSEVSVAGRYARRSLGVGDDEPAAGRAEARAGQGRAGDSTDIRQGRAPDLWGGHRSVLCQWHHLRRPPREGSGSGGRG